MFVNDVDHNLIRPDIQTFPISYVYSGKDNQEIRRQF